MREVSQLVLSPIAESLLKANRCPSCALPQFKWERTIKFRCCSVDCTQFFYDELVIATSWNELRIKVFDRDDRQCSMCWRQFEYSELIADHIVPIAMGGLQWDMDNIQTLCASKCNKRKTKMDAANIANYKRKNGISRKKVVSPYIKDKLLKDAILAGDLK